ncbi:MAG: hypothetical protein ABSA59_02640 [Terriglobia bacterium]|jgi:hypothetical protein
MDKQDGQDKEPKYELVGGTVHRLQDHYRLLGDQLGGMKNLLTDAQRLRYFEESLAANELGEALHALCDFLLEPDTPPVSGGVLEQIKSLHDRMELKDDCVEKLKQKANG